MVPRVPPVQGSREPCGERTLGGLAWRVTLSEQAGTQTGGLAGCSRCLASPRLCAGL